ncbi:hypothetical protein [Candidatus Deianiraea vastatrix]|uniref:Uncharacterized protein n=1 Tax=Candidatus Deianiraea vastatrix TaxID=2163644 RepID=A0A5B8XE30_9RICK|nr:hypothetical protein [Candidatus Deianiraea vastatrix]QED23523.1 hypothetical protein Deia_00733 [Candidatus Deianiraea vastatrix]
MDNYSTNYETQNSTTHTYNGTLYSRAYNRQDTVLSNESNVVNDQAQSVNTVSAEYNSSQQLNFQLNSAEIGSYNAVDIDNTNQKESIGQKNDFNIPPDNEQSVGFINKTQLAQQNIYSQLHKCNLMRGVNIRQIQSLKKQNSSDSLGSSK